jgi:hypothetical protein
MNAWEENTQGYKVFTATCLSCETKWRGLVRILPISFSVLKIAEAQ